MGQLQSAFVIRAGIGAQRAGKFAAKVVLYFKASDVSEFRLYLVEKVDNPAVLENELATIITQV